MGGLDLGSFGDCSADQSGSVPTVHRQVTLLTFGGESLGLVVGGRGFAKCGQVATHTLSREAEAIELAYRADFVTGVAVHRGVSAN